MAYNTRAIKLDVNSKPIPQYYNADVDDYEVLQGKNGANRVMLYDASGTPLLTSTNPGYVRADDGMIAALGALADAASTDPAAAASVIALLKGLLTRLANPATEATLEVLAGKDFATQATLAQVKTVLDTINTSTDGLEALMTAIRDTAGIKKVVDPVDVSDRAARALGKISADDGAIAALGALAASAVTDPAASASIIALLKGLLKQLQGGGTGAAPVTLNGSFAAIKAAPTVGAKTVTTTAAELFAGASRKAGRYLMSAHNEGSLIVYWGPSAVTVNSGYPLLPGDSVVWQFDPSTATPIYAVASGSTTVRVVEI